MSDPLPIFIAPIGLTVTPRERRKTVICVAGVTVTCTPITR